jgi:hypothetical protein
MESVTDAILKTASDVLLFILNGEGVDRPNADWDNLIPDNLSSDENTPDKWLERLMKLWQRSLVLFNGLDLYKAEFDALEVSLSEAEMPTTHWVAAVRELRTQLKIIDAIQSQLRDGYSRLRLNSVSIQPQEDELYHQAIRILREEPKVLFDLSPDSRSKREPVYDALDSIQNVVIEKRGEWAKREAFFQSATEILNDLIKEKKEFDSSKGTLELTPAQVERHEEVRQKLTLAINKGESDVEALDQARQLLADLRATIANEKKKQQELKDRDEDLRRRRDQVVKQVMEGLLPPTGVFMICFLLPFFLTWISTSNVTVSALKTSTGQIVAEPVQLPITGALNGVIPVLNNIPYVVFLWAFLGSLAAMYFQVNNSSWDRFLDVWELRRWALTRPLIGIVMGFVFYAAFYAGLLINSTQVEINTDTRTQMLLMLFVFVGAFSDRAQQALLGTIIGSVRGLNGDATPTPSKPDAP